MTQFVLDEICIRLSSGKSIPAAEVFEKGKYPVIGGNGVRGYADKANFSGGCVVIGRQGAACGNVRYFSGEAYMTEHAVVVQANKNHDTHFLAYLLSTMHLGQLSAQSAQPGLSVKTLSQQCVDMPSLDVQRAIVALLGTLDAKISLNSHLNPNLEEAMQCLYSEYFTYEQPTMGTIYDIADVIYGAPFKSSLFNEEGEGFPLIRIRDLSTYEPQFFTAEEHPKRTFIDPGDVLAGMDAEFVPTLWLGEKAVLNQRVCCFRPPEDSNTCPSYLLLALKPLLAFIQNYAAGTTVAHMGKGDLESLVVPLPKSADLKRFALQAEPMRRQMVLNAIENKRLRKLRDTLLPKLMSGKIDVSQIDLTQLNNHLTDY